jgi:hypothetical protein
MDSDTRSRWCAGVGGALIDLYFPGARSDMNRVVHFEIPADNLDRAKKVYGEKSPASAAMRAFRTPKATSSV